MRWQISVNNRSFHIEVPDFIPENRAFDAKIGDRTVRLRFDRTQKTLFISEKNSNSIPVERPLALRNLQIHSFSGEPQINFELEIAGSHGHLVQTSAEKILPGQENLNKPKTQKVSAIRSPITGKVLKVCVADGQIVEKNSLLCIIEAMKMENKIVAQSSGSVSQLHIKEGDSVVVGAHLMTIQ